MFNKKNHQKKYIILNIINDKASSEQFESKYLNELKLLVLQLSLSQQ